MAVQKKRDDIKIVLYSTGCPKCKVLEAKLNTKHISYKAVTDEKTIVDKGFKSFPVLKINEKYLNFSDANEWINGAGATLNAN